MLSRRAFRILCEGVPEGMGVRTRVVEKLNKVVVLASWAGCRGQMKPSGEAAFFFIAGRPFSAVVGLGGCVSSHG